MRACVSLLYLILCAPQVLAISAGLTALVQLGSTDALVCALLLAYVPVAGTVAAIVGAEIGWRLPWPIGSIVFIWSIPVSLAVIALTVRRPGLARRRIIGTAAANPARGCDDLPSAVATSTANGLAHKMERREAIRALLVGARADPTRAFVLATEYLGGRSRSRDASIAFLLFRGAAQAGIRSAQFNLALMYERGEGVKRDWASALVWYRAAAYRGHARALSRLAHVDEPGAHGATIAAAGSLGTHELSASPNPPARRDERQS